MVTLLLLQLTSRTVANERMTTKTTLNQWLHLHMPSKCLGIRFYQPVQGDAGDAAATLRPLLLVNVRMSAFCCPAAWCTQVGPRVVLACAQSYESEALLRFCSLVESRMTPDEAVELESKFSEYQKTIRTRSSSFSRARLGGRETCAGL